MGNQPTMQTDSLSSATGKYNFHFVRVSGNSAFPAGQESSEASLDV
jgi:hypothetical protein